MMAMLSAAASYTEGTLVGDDRMFNGVSTDTRSLGEGQLFVALQGPNFDGRNYVGEAVARGAAGALVAGATADSVAQIEVADTRIALGKLASGWRREQSAIVVGITGSNGKTTLKELTAACLAEDAPTLATRGNLNNDIGMPLMMTEIEPGHRYAVLEMGANHAGEIAYLTALAEPDVVAITNAGAAHLEGFGSIAGVARAKGEILCGKSRPGVAVLNADDKYFEFWCEMAAGAEIVSFGLENPADVSASNISSDGGGSVFELHLPSESLQIRLSLPGIHNVRNACAAAAIVTALGIAPAQVQAGLEKTRPVSGRLQPVRGVYGCTLYDDSYNANPLSVVAAAEFLCSLDGQSILVLGDMGELGDDSERLHQEVGTAAKRAGVERLFATGELTRHTVDAFGGNAEWHPSIDALLSALRYAATADVNILVKGSRFMRMERVIEALTASAPESD